MTLIQRAGAAVLLLASAGGSAAAQEPRAAASPTLEAASPFKGVDAPLAGETLARITGKADTAMTIRAQNSATVSNNSVTGESQTGTISFDAQAFSNLNGLSLLSANTGNNVAINSSLNVNVSIQR